MDKRNNRLPNIWFALLLVASVSFVANASGDSWFQRLRRNVSSLTGFQRFIMKSQAMVPTIMPAEEVLANMRYYQTNPIKRGDIVVMTMPDDPKSSMLTRVIALEGDKVSIKKATVYINGKPLKEPYVLPVHRVTKWSQEFKLHKVPNGKLFVMGDNRDLARDSRDKSWGDISKSSIQGKALTLYSKDAKRMGTKFE
jgi:signal peptidase I